MIKKLVIAGLILVGGYTLVALVGGPFKYVRTWVAAKMQSAEDQVPLDLKIQHARDEVEKLGPDVRKCMHVIAQQQVDVEHFQAQITRRSSDLVTQEAAILRLRDDLKRGDTSYVYAGSTYSSAEVRSDLRLRFGRYKTAQESLRRDRQIVAARRKSLIANEKRLDEMLAARKQLEVQIEQLEARWKTLQAAQTTSELEFDDSQLSRTKTLIRQLSKELDVRDKMLSADGKLSGLIPVESSKSAKINTIDITDEVDTFFKTDKKTANATTVANTK